MVTNDRRQIAVESRQKLRFNSISSEIIGRKFIKFVLKVAELLPFTLLKVALQSSDLLLNATAKSKGRLWRRLQTSPKFNWLP